jgi:hypothetical protein
MVKRLFAQASAAVSVVGLALLLGGCGQPQEAPPAGSAPASSPASTPAGSASPSAPASEPAPGTSTSATAAAPETTSAGKTGECKADQLAAEIRTEPGGGAAGSVYRSLVVTNTGSDDCTVRGYPGVSYVGAADQQVGAPADRDPAAKSVTVPLAPGASAVAQLQQTNADNYGPECDRTDVAAVRIYPPNDTAWLEARQQTVGCANDEIVLMTVGTFQPA